MCFKYLDRSLLALGAAAALALSGCQGPGAHIKTADAGTLQVAEVKTAAQIQPPAQAPKPSISQPAVPAEFAPEVIGQLNADAQIVSGTTAVADDKQRPNARTAEDKTGAIAVEMKY